MAGHWRVDDQGWRRRETGIEGGKTGVRLDAQRPLQSQRRLISLLFLNGESIIV